ncbi:MAG: TlpA family protein disulfide reductase [Acidobacteriota bacterium]
MTRRRPRSVAGLAFLLPALLAASASRPLHAAPVGRTAPEWEISEWLNADPGRLSDNRGKVVLIDFFQLWCPGCNAFSIPLFTEWEKRYAGRDDLLIVSIHTVFEGHAYQGPERLRAFVREKGIHHPVGIDAYASARDTMPITMRRYRTRGTPEVVIIDKRGRVRFDHLGSFRPEPVEALIEALLKESGPRESKQSGGGR